MGNGAGTRSTLARMSARRYNTGPSVTYDGRGQASLERTVGRALSDAEVATLAGAPAGANVQVRGLANSALLIVQRGGADSIQAQVLVSRDDRGQLTLGQMQADYVGATTRAKALAGQVGLARTLGIEQIGAKVHGNIAAGNWSLMPQLGFDASVERVSHELHVGRSFTQPLATIPAHLAGAKTYYDLWRGDPQWLQSVVMNPDLTFTTRADSDSSKRLADYLREHRGEA